MNILILGATGYLGTRLCSRLNIKGNNIYALVRESSKTDILLEKGLVKEYIWKIDELSNQLESGKIKIDWFINCACCYARNGVTDNQVIEANYVVPLKCIMICMEYGVHNYINIDTGLPDDFNIYSKSKAQLSDMLEWYAVKNNLYIRNLLLENYYGEDEPNNRFLPSIISKMKNNEDIFLTAGLQKRDFIYIDDVLSAIELLINIKDNVNYLDIPLGTGEGPSIREIVQYLASITNTSSRLLFGTVLMRTNEPDSVADIHIMKSLGWNYQFDWKAGLKKLIM